MHAAKISDVDWKHPVKHKILEANTLSKVRMGRVDSEWPAKVSRKKALLDTRLKPEQLWLRKVFDKTLPH